MALNLMVTTQQFLLAFVDPNENVYFRLFDDKKRGDKYPPYKLDVEAGRYASIEDLLGKRNSQGYGVFFVVNSGGQTDADITKINAQFVEMDDKSFEEQMELIKKFPLPPSIIVKTRKSYHVYWLMKDAKVEVFREVQMKLVKWFGGDKTVINESRVLRLPGFNHNKQDPVTVECIEFRPDRRYTQDELLEVLPADAAPVTGVTKGTQRGLHVIEESCDFIKHCGDNAATLSEHDWYAMISVLHGFEGGDKKIHELSSGYPKYTVEETNGKIAKFIKSGTGPMRCQTIAEKGFVCPKYASGECECNSPAAKSFHALELHQLREVLEKQPVEKSVVDDLQTAKKFIEDYMFNVDHVTAEAIINYDLKQHFAFKGCDLKALIKAHADLYKSFNNSSDTKRAKSKEQIPEWYEIIPTGLIFLPGVLAEHLKEHEAVFYAAEQYYKYENGVYKALTELEAKNIVRSHMLPRHTHLSQISDAEGQWKMQIQKPAKELNANPYLINLRNGLYNVLEDKLIEHTPDYLSTVQLAVNYTPDAQCPRFIKYLHESLPDDQVFLIQEMLGYFLVPINRAQKCFVIVGEAGAGKSVLLLVLNDILLGKENVSNVTWQSLNERFKTAELFGKLANIFADLPTKNIDDNGIFKALVGEDYLTVEKKNKNPFSFQPYARLLFSCNNIPRNYGDKSEGFYRRLIIIRFAHAVAEAKRDPELLDKFRQEADGIFLFALEGLKRLMKNNFKFSVTDTNVQELQKYREDSNSVLSFVNDCCELGPKFEAVRTEIYNQYKNYCTACGLSPYSQKSFNNELETAYPQLVRGTDSLGKRRTWKGIKLGEFQD